jgi:hypothetical protein
LARYAVFVTAIALDRFARVFGLKRFGGRDAGAGAHPLLISTLGLESILFDSVVISLYCWSPADGLACVCSGCFR